jgi:transposase
MKCKRKSDGRVHDHHSLQTMRMQALKAVREGQAVASVSDTDGLNVRTVFRGLANFAIGGQNALLAEPIRGRPPKVLPEELRWMARAVPANSPQRFEFPCGLWSPSLLGKSIKCQFGKSLSLASVSRVR